MRAALSVHGWWVTVVSDRQSSMRASADQAPDLVLVESGLLGAGELVDTFASAAGGPGLILLGASEEAWSERADELLATPVDTQHLVPAVRRLLETPRPVPAGAPIAAEQRLTAAEIFAEVLHEVEHGVAEPASVAKPAGAPEVLTVPPEIAAPPAPAARRVEAPAAAVRSSASPPGGGHAAVAKRAAKPGEPEATRFGQFQLEERIAVGGMAEVWKARMTGVEGFEKTVAIKKILPHLSESGDFEKMFIEEAKLAADLNHDNIVRINDLGRIEDSYFIAMEYVEGKDLRRILTAARKRGERIPLGLSVLIGTRLASALDYAHRHVVGSAEGIVHRDVSPRNVLIGYGGGVKLCDFGIAKASSRVSSTRTGAIKGKLQFMSPEQAWGRPVDGRSDIFSLGIVLFEMITGERLFQGDNEISLLDTVRGCMVRSPRDVDPKVPEDLDEVVMRALRASPADRYQSAGDMQRDLEKILYALEPMPGSEDLAAFVGRLFEGRSSSEPASSRRPAVGSESASASVSAPEAATVSATASPPGAAADARAERPSEVAAGDLWPDVELPQPRLVPQPADETSSDAGPEAPPGAATAGVPEAEETTAEREATAVDDAAFATLADDTRGAVGGRRRVVGLIAVVALAAALALALYTVLRSGSAADPAPPAAAEAPAPVDPADPTSGAMAPTGTPVESPPPAPASGAASPEATAAPAEPPPAPLEDLVSREMARREAELRRRFETEQERMLQELEELQPAAADPPPATDESATDDDGDGDTSDDDGGGE